MRICKIDGCGRPVRMRGWCQKHYQRWWRHGDPLAGGRTRNQTDAEAVAWVMRRKVDRRPDGCWIWTGAPNSSRGYGRIGLRGRQVLIHRLACEHAHGPAPAGKPFAIHSCDRPSCCNPAHLRWGSHADNMQDRLKRGRANLPAGEIHYRAKLTASRVREIRTLRAAGASG